MATVTGATAARMQELEDYIYAVVGSIGLVQTSKVDGNITLAVSGVWADVDPSGTAAARSLDIVIPDVAIGDGFDFRPFFTVGTSTGGLLMNLAIISEGAVVRRCFDATYGLLPWSAPANQTKDINALSPRQIVQSGDLEPDGSLRLRLQYIQATATRAINAAAIIPLVLEGRGPFRPSPA